MTFMLEPNQNKEDLEALNKLREYKDIFITLELCVISSKSLKISPKLTENKLRKCVKLLKKRIKDDKNKEILCILDKKKVLLPSILNWLKNRDNYHREFDFYIKELEKKLSRCQQ